MKKFVAWTCIVVVCLLSCVLSCFASDKWEDEAGKTAMWGNKEKHCAVRVIELGKKMKDAGVPFQVALGKYGTERNASTQNTTYVPGNYGHCWIVLDDKILDPSQLNDGAYMYTEEHRMPYSRFVEMFR